MKDKKDALVQKDLQRLHSLYDNEFYALREKVKRTDEQGREYETFFHTTRSSFGYAVMLLKYGNAEEAIKIIKKSLSQQNRDKNSQYYGLWPRYHEEPIEKMSTVDENWAAFCINHLLQMLIRYSDALPDELQVEIRETIAAALVFIKKRDITPAYTNVSVLDFVVCILAGEYYSWKDTYEYGKQKLIEACEYLKQTGGFTEYNSSNYIKIVIDELGVLYALTKSEEIKPYLAELLDRAWKNVAEHYHKNTNQWCAPQSRSYSTALMKNRSGWLKCVTGRETEITDEDEFPILYLDGQLELRCPKKYLEYFYKPRTAMHREEFCNGTELAPRQVASWYMRPEYCIGSFSMSDLWGQRRALTGYWGTESDVRFLNVRMLLNGRDFSSGIIHAAQNENAILGIVNFIYDGGNTHIVLDRINGKIRVQDLRLRFEIQTNDKDIKVKENTYVYEDSYLTFQLDIIKSLFDGKEVEKEIVETEGKVCIDVIFSRGDTELDLRTMGESFCAFSLSFGKSDVQLKNVSLTTDDSTVCISAETKSEPMMLIADSAPCSRDQLYNAAKLGRNIM